VSETSGRGPTKRKHAVVREHLRELLADAEAGTPVPSERVLVQQFGMARTTVRQAIDALVAEGLLERIPSRGTYVARPRAEAGRLRSFSEEMARRGLAVGARTLEVGRARASPGVARALGLAEGGAVVHWRRLRLADGVPMCVEETYLNDALVPGFLDAPPPPSLYDDLARRGLRPTWAEDSVRAEAAHPDDAELLQVPVGVPVLRVARRALCREEPVAVSRSAFRADRFTLWVQYADT
jgi:GntR family transcriptional regulator